MVCLSFSSNGCQDGTHPTALDYFLAVLIMFTAVVAARLLASAVSRCLCGHDGPDTHHHHHHGHDHHHHSPDATDDVDELPWGGGAGGLAIFGQPGMGVPPPPPPRRNDHGWHWHGMVAPAPVAPGTTTERVGHVAHPGSPQRQHLG